MNDHQLLTLRKLERAIFEAGIDGGEATSEAIDRLHEKEREYGVFDENAETPRWQQGS